MQHRININILEWRRVGEEIWSRQLAIGIIFKQQQNHSDLLGPLLSDGVKGFKDFGVCYVGMPEVERCCKN